MDVQEAIHSEPMFCDLREKQQQEKDLLIWLKSALLVRGDLMMMNLIENEIASLRSIKTQFGLLVKFSTTRDGETQYMQHYFNQTDPAILT